MAAASAAALPADRLLTDRLPNDELAADDSRLAVIVVTAGRSSRREGVDKTFAEIDGAPLVIHTLRRLAASDAVCRIALVVAKDAVARAGELTHRHAVPKLAAMAAAGYTVRVFAGSPDNIKVTTPEDLAIVAHLLAAGR